MHTTQGDVLLPLSTLKRTDAQSVWPNWTQSKVRQTDKQMSDEGGQATNSLPAMQYHQQNDTTAQFLVAKRNNIQFARISFNAVGFNAIMNTYIVKFREVCL